MNLTSPDCENRSNVQNEYPVRLINPKGRETNWWVPELANMKRTQREAEEGIFWKKKKKTIIEYGGRVYQKLWGVLLKAAQWASDLAERERENE